MANSKDIELAIKARDLASKPIQEIGAAVDKLVSAVADIVPASEKGAKNLTDLTATAGQLQKAMLGLKADAALVESFTALSAKVEDASQKLKALQETADAAKLALANAAEPSKAMQQAATSSAAAAARQEKALAGLVTRLDTLKTAMTGAGIDFNNLAGAQSKIDAAFNTAAPAYAKVNEALDQYSANQRKAAVAAKEAAAAAEQLALKEKAHAEAAAESNAMAERFTQAMRQEASAAAEATTKHSGFLQSLSSMRSEGLKSVEFIRDFRRELGAMAAGFFGLMGAIQAAKSGFESIESLEGSKSILTQTFGAAGAGQQLNYIKGQADRLSLSYVELTKQYAKFAAAAAGSGTSQEQARQIFETFAEAARVKNLSGEQQASVFQALDKIFAKDSVGATELFRKLSTDLPEAAAIFRKSIDTLDGTPLTTDQFERLLKSGKITSEFVAKFAADYRASFADQLPAATNTTTAALQKFRTAWDDFKISILEGGALDAFKETLQQLTEFFKSPDGKRFSTELAQGARLIADGLGLVVRNLDAVKAAVAALAVLWAANVGKAFVADLARLVAGFQKVNLAVEALTKGASGLMAVIGKLSALFAAFYIGEDIGTWLYRNVGGVRAAGAAVIGSFALMFQKIGDVASLMWARVFHPGNVDALRQRQEKAWAASIQNFRENIKSAGGSQDDGAPSAPGDTTAGLGAATATTITPQQRAAAALAARKALDEQLFDAAKSLQSRLSTMRGELMKKDATNLKSYLAGMAESFKPLYDEIAKLKQDFPHANQTVINALTGQLNAIKSQTMIDARDKFNENKAKRDLQDINALLQRRDQLIQNQNRKVADGVQSPAQAQANVASITATANPAILENLTKLQGFVSSLPADVQTKLQSVTDELALMLDKLEERPAKNALKDIQEQENAINQTLELRDTRLSAVKQLAAAGLISTQQEKIQLVAINGEYDKTIDKAKALVEYIETSKDLTDDQRKALEGVVAKLDIAIASAKTFNAAIYPATRVADDIAQGGVNVAAAFAKAAASGRGLGGAFTSAWQAFKAFASDFLLKIGEMILKTELLNALGYGGAGGSGGIAGAISSGISAITGQGVAASVSTGLFNSELGSMGEGLAVAAQMHGGGNVSRGAGLQRIVDAAHFQFARKYHNGGMPGLGPDEIPIIAQTGEHMLSRAQVAAGVGGPAQPQHIMVNNLLDHEDIVRRGLAAPSNVKVITNIIRANRTGIRQALA